MKDSRDLIACFEEFMWKWDLYNVFTVYLYNLPFFMVFYRVVFPFNSKFIYLLLLLLCVWVVHDDDTIIVFIVCVSQINF